jgi:hypothetical protein
LTFDAFKNYHLNECLIVCGLGQSLRSFRPPDGIATIGVNDIGRLFHPTYLLNVNHRSQYKGDRYSYIENTQAKYLFTQQPRENPGVKIPIVEFEIQKKGGGVEIEDNRLPHFRNSPYMGVALAGFMGAARIGIIGVDFTENHFWLQDGKHRLECELESIDAHYGALAAHLYQSQGTRVFNLSTISRLTSIPRITFDDFARG